MKGTIRVLTPAEQSERRKRNKTEYMRQYRAENPEICRAASRRYRDSHTEIENARKLRYQERHTMSDQERADTVEEIISLMQTATLEGMSITQKFDYDRFLKRTRRRLQAVQG